MGFGFSIWFVPYNYVEFQKTYSIRHIPHVTVKTNMTKEECKTFYIAKMKSACRTFEFDADLRVIPNMWNGPLQAVGWFVHDNDVLHMTMRYFRGVPRYFVDETAPTGEISFFSAMADTTSEDSTNWSLMKP